MIGIPPQQDAFVRSSISFLVPTLSFIEQVTIYDAVKAKFDTTSPNNMSVVTSSSPYAIPVSAFWCPSDSQAPTISGDPARTSYKGCFGDIYSGSNDNVIRSMYRRGDITTVSFAHILDGTSNTIMLGEMIVPFFPDPPTGKDYHPRKGGIAPYDGLARDGQRNIADCMTNAALNPNDSSVYKLPVTSLDTFRYHGARYAWYASVRFFTMMPPNGPNCSNSSQPVNVTVATASSYHKGGVNVAMADGSVRFVSDNINTGDPSITVSTFTGLSTTDSIATKYGGVSPWGVWGALGSIAGGENVTL